MSLAVPIPHSADFSDQGPAAAELPRKKTAQGSWFDGKWAIHREPGCYQKSMGNPVKVA